MTEEDKRCEDLEWDDVLETAYQKEQDANKYWKMTEINN